MGISVGERLETVRFRPSGFDYLRITLAVCVVFFHTFLYSYGNDYNTMIWHSPARGFVKFVVPMFFCLSGFLVAGSMERCKTLISFIGLRVIRIYPALVVEIFLSAFIIGPLVTVSPLQDYFTGSQFFRYLLNSTGAISYHLPGVFLSNVYPGIVNSQLWTVPFELCCYVALSVLILLGVKGRRHLVIWAIVLWIGYIVAKKILGHESLVTPEAAGGTLLVANFLAGVGVYLYRDRIPYDHRLTVITGLAAFLLMGFVPGGDIPAVFPLAYVTVGLGLTNFKRLAFIGFADFSYGIYLYGGVIGQLMIDRFAWSHHWYLNFALTLPVTALFAMFSWYVVEKPALSLKGRLSGMEVAWLARRTALAKNPV